MSLEMLRFSWQKLLINQVPQKGGGGGAPGPNYQALWDQAQATFGKAAEVSSWASGQLAASPGNPATFNAINNRVNAEIANIDGVINQTSGIPDYIFDGGEISKSAALNLLQNARNGVAACTVVVPSPPPPPPPPVVPTPPTSSVLQPIAPLINPVSLPPITVPLPTPEVSFGSSGGASGLLNALSSVGAGIVGGIPNQVIRRPSFEFCGSGPGGGLSTPLSTQDGTWEPTGNIDGVGTYSLDSGPLSVPSGISLQAVCFGEDGNSYPFPGAVPKGKRWSFKPWRWQPRHIQDPAPPACNPPYPPPPQPESPKLTEYQLLAAELTKQTAQLKAINRILNKPIDPAPPQNIYPSTSWQYEFWNKGYSLHEISYAEDRAAQQNLLTTTNGDFALFKVKVEDLLQDAILSKQIPPATSQEVVPLPPPPVIGFDPTTGYATTVNNFEAGLLGPRTREEALALGWTIQDNVLIPPTPSEAALPVLISQSTPAPVPVPPVLLPTPYVDENNKRIDPKKIPGYLRRNRQFISRGIKNRPIDINDLPSVPAVAPNTVPRKDYWEDCLVGAGATVAQLDTIRRTMATVFLAPNADVCEVTKNMLTKLQTSNVKDPLGLYGKPNAINNIPGVAKSSISNATIIKSNAIAQRKTQQARRGALNNRK